MNAVILLICLCMCVCEYVCCMYAWYICGSLYVCVCVQVCVCVCMCNFFWGGWVGGWEQTIHLTRKKGQDDCEQVQREKESMNNRVKQMI